MRALLTKYHGPTNSRGSRITATAGAGGARVTVSYDCAKNSDGNHDAAALALCAKMGWTGDLIRGWTEDRNGRATGAVYVFANSERISNQTERRD